MTEPSSPDGAHRSEASILIVEDDPGAAEAFEYMLKAEGYEVRLAPDVQSAFAELERNAPAAIVLDLHLPITDGLGALRRLRATTQHAHIPVAVVTGNYLVDERVAQELQELGARLYLKPIWEEDLLRIVSSLANGPALR